ncbi:MAG: hypothetical protein LBC62_09185 [Treponema sp.]|nr:hypothetical protein [Treponema sp.]
METDNEKRRPPEGRMAHILSQRVKYLFGALIILYPLLVFSALVIFKLSIRYLSILVILLAIAYILINRRRYHGRHPMFIFITPAILFSIGLVCLIIDSDKNMHIDPKLVFKVYPALADLVYVTIMGTSLFIPPPLVSYFVTMFDKSLKDHLDPAYLERYCRKATIIWCVFFFIDAIIAMITVIWTSELVWGIYNGGVTYVLMGMIFIGEYVIIKIIEKKTLKKRMNDPETAAASQLKDSEEEEKGEHS